EEIRRDDHVERLRMRDEAGGEGIDVVLREAHVEIVERDLRDDLVPQDRGMAQRVRFRGRGQTFRTATGTLEGVARDTFDPAAGEHARLEGRFRGRASAESATDARVF